MYRPLSFSSVIGQDVAIKLIQNALNFNKLPRAIILYGPSGTGKTTIARLISAYFVCENKNSDVCGKCSMCLAVQDNSITDILEFDAASNTSVEDIRQIIDQANYAPQYSSEKIFIIDEAHMLSRSAISAFLKVLEETSSHVRFIMATTEIDKIPDSIRSRCLCIAMHEISSEKMKNYLISLFEEKNISYENEALDLLVNLSNGSMREVLSIISQVLMLENKIDIPLLISVLAFADFDSLELSANYILNAEFVLLFEFLNKLFQKNVSSLPFLRQLIFYFRKQFNVQLDKKDKILKILIDLNKLYQDSSKISCFNEMILIGLAQIAFENK